MASEQPFDDADRRELPVVFVSDPTGEAESVARALRSGGFTVVDVPLSMLVARAAVQHPRVVVVDADSHGALDVVARMRELPRADDVHVVFIAAPGGAISTLEEARAHEGSGLSLRPIDVPDLVRQVEALSGAPPVPPEGDHPSSPPPAIASASRPSSTAPPAAPSAPRLAGFSPGFAETVSFSEPPLAPSRVPPPKALSLAPPISGELERLLEDAERRVHIALDPDPGPTPEQEIEAVLPAELLAALDEPLEDDDDPEPAPARGASPSGAFASRERTTDGGASRTTGASTGGGPTPASDRVDVEETLTPSPPSHGSAVTSAGPPALESEGAGHPEVAAAGVGPPAPASAESLRPERRRDARSLDMGAGDAVRILGRAIAARTSGSLCFTFDGVPLERDRDEAGQAEATITVERRVVLREGDVVTCASTAEDESLIAFLGVRGDLPRETVRRLGSRFPASGRHAGAALVARGYVLQDQMWATLRAHAEWILGRALQPRQVTPPRAVLEPQPPGRLAGEPSVFGGASGAEVFVEIVRRIVSPDDSVERLGGSASRLGRGSAADLLDECAFGESEAAIVVGAAGHTIEEVLALSRHPEFASSLFALIQLGVLEVLRSVGDAGGGDDRSDAEVAAIDVEAMRERVRARMQLVEEGDYFAVLGVSPDATGYEVKRAFLELRRAFDPSRLVRPELGDLLDDVRKIAVVLDEAYEILKDGARRERYRRAIEGSIPRR